MPRNNLCGTVLSQKYELLSFLGSGGMSDVYKAQHRTTGKVVAVKLLHDKHAADPVTVKRLKQEAKVAGALAHRGILAIHDIDVDDSGMPFLVMDFVDGLSLAEFLRTKGPLNLPTFLHIVDQITAAFAHAEEKGVVHRDLKPGNVMLVDADTECEVKLVDFGIAKLLDQDDGTAHRLTQTGETFGSPSYMSPEQCMSTPVDSRSDMYALGCVMYELLSGHVPFQGDSIFETIHKQVADTPPPLVAPQITDPSLKARVEAIILKCLAKNASDRYASFNDLHSELQKLHEASGGSMLSSIGNRISLAAAKQGARQKTKVPMLVCSLILMAILSIASSAYLVYTNVEVEKGFRALKIANTARTKWLQSYVYSALMYRAGQAYLRSRDRNDLHALQTGLSNLEAAQAEIDRLSKEDPTMNARYAEMTKLLHDACRGFNETINQLPTDVNEVAMLYKIAPKLHTTVRRALAVQSQICAMQNQEDASLDLLQQRVENLQHTLIQLSIFTLVLDGSLIAAIAFYFLRHKKKTGSASAPPVATTT